MKIGVIGLGVVGKAVHEAFRMQAEKTTRAPLDVVGYDKDGEFSGNWDRIVTCDLVFLCLPTPTLADGSQDTAAIQDVSNKLKEDQFSGVIVIKSTVLPGTTKRLAEAYGLTFAHNPEFLKASQPLVDFLSLRNEIVSGDQPSVALVRQAYKYMPWKEVVEFRDFRVTETAKYGRNTLLATTVSHWNEFFEVCQAQGVRFEDMRRALLCIGEISSTHSQVPGPDGKLGWGGSCFPKDTVAFQAHIRSLGIKCEILDAAISGNLRRRQEAV